jgi:hypothetical protein
MPIGFDEIQLDKIPVGTVVTLKFREKVDKEDCETFVPMIESQKCRRSTGRDNGSGNHERRTRMVDKDELCRKIREIYPDIGECGIDVKVAFDESNQRWTVNLKKGSRQLKTFLEEGDAELCLQGKQCVSLGIEISQLRGNIEQL